MTAHNSSSWRAFAPAAAAVLLFVVILVALLTAPRASLLAPAKTPAKHHATRVAVVPAKPHELGTGTAVVIALCAAGLLGLALAVRRGIAPQEPRPLPKQPRDPPVLERGTEVPLGQLDPALRQREDQVRWREGELVRREGELDRRAVELGQREADLKRREAALRTGSQGSGAEAARDREQIVDSCVRIADGVDDPRVKAMLATALQHAGVHAIDPLPGARFDDAQHVAVAVVETTEAARHETIAAVVRKGYRDRDRLLRAAEVQVYTNSTGAQG